MPNRDDYEFAHITGAATTVIIGAACKLICVNINTASASGLISVYNAATSATSLASNAVGIIGTSVIAGAYLRGGMKLATGLTVVTPASSDVTVVYATA